MPESHVKLNIQTFLRLSGCSFDVLYIQGLFPKNVLEDLEYSSGGQYVGGGFPQTVDIGGPRCSRSDRIGELRTGTTCGK
jgi:hypothetical protein